MLIVKPNISIPDIEIKIDENNEFGAEQIKKQWGPNIPIVKINDYVLSTGSIRSYDVSVQLNSILTFNLEIEDDNNFIKDSLKSNEYNKVVIFIGTEYWYHKYVGVILNSYSNDNNFNITFDGYIFADKMFETEQVKYDDKTVSDILNSICVDSNIGLYLNSNSAINYKFSEIINTNKSRYEFIKYLIGNFTDNVFSFDSNYILHVGNLNSFVDKKIGQINYFENYQLPNPIDLTISNEIGINEVDIDNENLNEDFLLDINKLAFSNYSIDDKKLGILKKEYSILDENSNKIDLFINDYGIGNKTENFFSGFKNKYLPNYNEIVNKQLTGKVFTIEMNNNFYEIYPFMAINLELFTDNKENTEEQIKNEIDSGKKIIIGYSYHYRKNKQKIIQKLKLI